MRDEKSHLFLKEGIGKDMRREISYSFFKEMDPKEMRELSLLSREIRENILVCMFFY